MMGFLKGPEMSVQTQGSEVKAELVKMQDKVSQLRRYL